jgi:hypothetical protein
MTDTNPVELTDEQKAAATDVALKGRVADVDKAIQERLLVKTPEALAKEEADKKAAEDAAKKADEEAAKVKTDDDDGKWKEEEWVAVGNEHADAAIELMKEAGVKPVEGNEIFKDAIASGDLSKVKWDVLEARIGAAKAKLVRAGVESYFNSEYKAQQEIVGYAHDKVGGEEGWTKIQTWAKKAEKSDAKFASDLNEYRKALKVGGFAARAAVDAIKAAYEADPKNGSIGNKPLERGKVDPTPKVEGEPLNRLQFFREMEKAGGDRAPKHVVEALRARRQAGVKLGM